MPDTVLYHANCWDGFCAAWLIHFKFPNAEFLPVHYGTDPPWDHIDDKNVWIVDFSYKRPVMEEIASRVKSENSAPCLVVLDHHKTAQQELDGLDYCTFCMDASGARLTWDLLQPNGWLPTTMLQAPWSFDNPHWLVKYTEDRDLWRWQLDQSREVNAAIRSYPLRFSLWTYRWLDMVGPDHVIVSEGEAILRRERQIVDDHTRHGQEVVINGRHGRIVNATTLFSEIAGELAEGYEFGACYFDRSDGMRQYSLRSRDGGCDVSELAKEFGGGGHRNASGFETDQSSFVWTQ